MAVSRKKKNVNIYVLPETHARLNAMAAEQRRIPGVVIDILVEQAWKAEHVSEPEPAFVPYYEPRPSPMNG